jgi:hypothetical protein
VLRYQSGNLIESPLSNNQLLTELGRGAFSGPGLNNPAIWGGGATTQNVVPGQNFFSVNPNCGCFNPQTTLSLNPAAWVDSPGGSFGTAAPYYNGNRWQRQPAENMSFGRIFSIGREGKYKLQVRAEFQNIFNRLQIPQPSTGSPNVPTLITQSQGLYTGGYGYMSTVGGGGDQPRTGQLVGRFTF